MNHSEDCAKQMKRDPRMYGCTCGAVLLSWKQQEIDALKAQLAEANKKLQPTS